MLSIKDRVSETLELLDESELRQVANYLDFLRFSSRRSRITPSEAELAAYAEFAEEDRAMAEEGMDDYAAALEAEDSK